MTLQNHIHLQELNGSQESGIYHIKLGALDTTPTIPLIIDRALNSTIWYHRILDASGLPIIISNQTFTLINMSTAEKDALILLSAKPIYYIAVVHANDGDTGTHTSERVQVIMAIKSGSIQPVDPGLTYWQATVEVTNA